MSEGKQQASIGLSNPFDVIVFLINHRFDTLEKALLNKNTAKAQGAEQPIDINAAAKILNKAVSTIYVYTHRQKIPFYKQGNSLYFYESELLQWLAAGRVKTCFEVEQEAANFISKNK